MEHVCCLTFLSDKTLRATYPGAKYAYIPVIITYLSDIFDEPLTENIQFRSALTNANRSHLGTVVKLKISQMPTTPSTVKQR